MSISGRIFAAMYDRIMASTEKAGLRDQRSALLASASGDVLEIGAGTGLNLPFYAASVTSLTMTDPEPPMCKRLQKRVQAEAPLTTVLSAPAEDLPFDDDSFDTVVSTLVLCTVDDQQRALREIRRVLRPGGRMLFIEHIRSDDEKLSRKQDRMNGLNRIVAHGCNCNRPTMRSLREEGYDVEGLEHSTLNKAPSFLSPLVIGTAT